jgi:hypothetical protein
VDAGDGRERPDDPAGGPVRGAHLRDENGAGVDVVAERGQRRDQAVQRRALLPSGGHRVRREEGAVRRLRLGHHRDHDVEAPVVHAPLIMFRIVACILAVDARHGVAVELFLPSYVFTALLSCCICFCLSVVRVLTFFYVQWDQGSYGQLVRRLHSYCTFESLFLS